MNLSLLGNLRKALLALTVACFVAGVAIAPACDRAALENYIGTIQRIVLQKCNGRIGGWGRCCRLPNRAME